MTKYRKERTGSAGKKRWIRSCAAVLFFILLVCFLRSFYSSANELSVTFYSYDAQKLSSPVRIVQLSDLHSHEFGKDNEKLLWKLQELEPDLIFCTGDMLNASDPDSRNLQNLIRELTRIAPVYYSLGNHEISYMEQHDREPIVQEIGQAVYTGQSGHAAR